MQKRRWNSVAATGRTTFAASSALRDVNERLVGCPRFHCRRTDKLAARSATFDVPLCANSANTTKQVVRGDMRRFEPVTTDGVQAANSGRRIRLLLGNTLQAIDTIQRCFDWTRPAAGDCCQDRTASAAAVVGELNNKNLILLRTNKFDLTKHLTFLDVPNLSSHLLS